MTSGMGPVGLAISGAFLFNHLSNPMGSNDVAAVQEDESFDTCMGHSAPGCIYHYHRVRRRRRNCFVCCFCCCLLLPALQVLEISEQHKCNLKARFLFCISEMELFFLFQAPKTGCIPNWNECTLVGWMRDGFPVYSYCRKGNAKSGPFLRTCYEKKNGV